MWSLPSSSLWLSPLSSSKCDHCPTNMIGGYHSTRSRMPYPFLDCGGPTYNLRCKSWILLKWVAAVSAAQRRKGEGEGSSWCSGKLTWKSTDWCENGHGQAFYTQQVVAKPLKLFCWMIYTPCVSATFILFYMFQNMKYTKSRGLLGPNIFLILSCSGFLSDIFAAEYWSWIPPLSHCQHN